MRARTGIVLALCATGVLAVACDQKHMREQPRYKPYAAAPAFENDMSARWPPQGTVARDDPIEPRPPQPPVTEALLVRGRTMFDAVCSPCHSPVGDGDGMIVRRGFPHPPTFHSDRLRKAPDVHFYDVITRGFGIMYPYANRVTPADRWAIAAYIRALQLSQDALVAELPAEDRARLEAATGTGRR